MNNDSGALRPAKMSEVEFTGGLLGGRRRVNREVTLPIDYEQCERTGRIDAWKQDWTPGDPRKPHIFWDSDVAKWVEAASYSLTTDADTDLQAMVQSVVDLIVSAQQPDGYLNSYYTAVEPENRWTNLHVCHELYCAGHLMEAAVAWHEATGRRDLLDAMCRYANYIDSVFGAGEGRIEGYPGHEEIELALVKLYHATDEDRYLRLAKFFVDERGQEPYYFGTEAEKRGDLPPSASDYSAVQAHMPVRDQKDATGHAVRAMYLYAGMADIAHLTGDDELARVTRTLWDSTVRRRMYITGGVGSTRVNEKFTFDYDLPNETAYAESCAAIGLMFFARRMLNIEPKAEYADVMERALYNGVLSGVSLMGDRFFYVNPLEHHPGTALYDSERFVGTRQPWFDTACCPPNIARILAGLGENVYSARGDEVYVHLYAGSGFTTELDACEIAISQETDYPWDGAVKITVEQTPGEFALCLRNPGWCRSMTVTINGGVIDVGAADRDGYVVIRREWLAGDVVEINMPMPIERVTAHPSVRMNAGRVAIQRGPVVYCLEESDNAPDLNAICLPRDADLSADYRSDFLGGCVVISGKAFRRTADGWDGVLYATATDRTIRYEETTITAIPYALWANREHGEMLVWIPEYGQEV
jgi:uncharacterized protein